MCLSLTPSWIFLTYFNQFSGMLTWGLGWNKILSMWRSLEINESISSCRTNLLTNDPVSLIPPAKFGEWVSRARILHASTFLHPPLPARPRPLQSLTPQFIRFERNIERALKLMYPVNGIRSQPAFSKPYRFWYISAQSAGWRQIGVIL